MNSLAALFGARLRQLREAHEMRVGELAIFARLDPSTISKIESGDRLPSMELVKRFAEVFGVDELDLFTFPATHARHRLIDLTRRATEVPLRECETLLRRRLRERGVKLDSGDPE